MPSFLLFFSSLLFVQEVSKTRGELRKRKERGEALNRQIWVAKEKKHPTGFEVNSIFFGRCWLTLTTELGYIYVCVYIWKPRQHKENLRGAVLSLLTFCGFFQCDQYVFQSPKSQNQTLLASDQEPNLEAVTYINKNTWIRERRNHFIDGIHFFSWSIEMLKLYCNWSAYSSEQWNSLLRDEEKNEHKLFSPSFQFISTRSIWLLLFFLPLQAKKRRRRQRYIYINEVTW